MVRRFARKSVSEEVNLGLLGNVISNAARKLQASFRGRQVRQSIAESDAMFGIGDGASDGDSDGSDSDGESDYTDSDEDREGIDEMLNQFDAEYGDRPYYLSDIERLTYTGKVTQEAGIAAITVSLVTTKTCRHMEAALTKRAKQRDRIFMNATTYAGGVENPRNQIRGRTEFGIMLQAIFDKLPRRRDGSIGFQSPLEMCLFMIYAAGGKEAEAPRVARRAVKPRAKDGLVVPEDSSHGEAGEAVSSLLSAEFVISKLATAPS